MASDKVMLGEPGRALLLVYGQLMIFSAYTAISYALPSRVDFLSEAAHIATIHSCSVWPFICVLYFGLRPTIPRFDSTLLRHFPTSRLIQEANVALATVMNALLLIIIGVESWLRTEMYPDFTILGLAQALAAVEAAVALIVAAVATWRYVKYQRLAGLDGSLNEPLSGEGLDDEHSSAGRGWTPISLFSPRTPAKDLEALGGEGGDSHSLLYSAGTSVFEGGKGKCDADAKRDASLLDSSLSVPFLSGKAVTALQERVRAAEAAESAALARCSKIADQLSQSLRANSGSSGTGSASRSRSRTPASAGKGVVKGPSASPAAGGSPAAATGTADSADSAAAADGTVVDMGSNSTTAAAAAELASQLKTVTDEYRALVAQHRELQQAHDKANDKLGQYHSELKRAAADVEKFRFSTKALRKENEKLTAALHLEREANAQSQATITDLRARAQAVGMGAAAGAGYGGGGARGTSHRASFSVALGRDGSLGASGAGGSAMGMGLARGTSLSSSMGQGNSLATAGALAVAAAASGVVMALPASPAAFPGTPGGFSTASSGIPGSWGAAQGLTTPGLTGLGSPGPIAMSLPLSSPLAARAAAASGLTSPGGLARQASRASMGASGVGFSVQSNSIGTGAGAGAGTGMVGGPEQLRREASSNGGSMAGGSARPPAAGFGSPPPSRLSSRLAAAQADVASPSLSTAAASAVQQQGDASTGATAAATGAASLRAPLASPVSSKGTGQGFGQGQGQGLAAIAVGVVMTPVAQRSAIAAAVPEEGSAASDADGTSFGHGGHDEAEAEDGRVSPLKPQVLLGPEPELWPTGAAGNGADVTTAGTTTDGPVSPVAAQTPIGHANAVLPQLPATPAGSEYSSLQTPTTQPGHGLGLATPGTGHGMTTPDAGHGPGQGMAGNGLLPPSPFGGSSVGLSSVGRHSGHGGYGHGAGGLDTPGISVRTGVTGGLLSPPLPSAPPGFGSPDLQ